MIVAVVVVLHCPLAFYESPQQWRAARYRESYYAFDKKFIYELPLLLMLLPVLLLLTDYWQLRL